MKIITRLVSLVLIVGSVTSHQPHPLSDEFIDLINSKQTLWTAGRNFHRHTSLEYLNGLAGTLKPKVSFDDGLTDNPPVYDYAQKLPFEFDARKKWKYCPSINDIRDQGSCRSCWAVSTASALTDRRCIEKAYKYIYFSALDLMSCCNNCGNACRGGGLLSEAWIYAKDVGVVSGGSYDSGYGCKPYTVPPCEHIMKHHIFNYKPCNNNFPVSMVCNHTCVNGRADYRYKIKLYTNYRMSDEKKIMADIYNNGPVTTVFALFEDFFNYKSGVYVYTHGKMIGYHAVKVIGWGEEKGVTYWLVANSWNSNWGDRGFFKILRGRNHLGIEDAMYTGMFLKM